jgi:hypothetical protein
VQIDRQSARKKSPSHMSEKVASDYSPDPYADYAALLSASFSPSSHANTLILATNDPSDRQTDLASPLKRIQYDLEEVNRRIDQLVRIAHIAWAHNLMDRLRITAKSSLIG